MNTKRNLLLGVYTIGMGVAFYTHPFITGVVCLGCGAIVVLLLVMERNYNGRSEKAKKI